MKLIFAAAFAMTVCSVQSQTIAKITTNQWTSDYLHVSGTLDNPTDAHLNCIGYDADKHEVAHSDSFAVEKDGSFNVSFADPKREIRFVKVVRATYAAPAIEAIPTPAAPTRSVEQLALEAWHQEIIVPGDDMKFNRVLIGIKEADWKDYFHKKDLLQPADDQKFDDAFEACVHRTEDRLQGLLR
jgi:hypothetical protein